MEMNTFTTEKLRSDCSKSNRRAVLETRDGHVARMCYMFRVARGFQTLFETAGHQNLGSCCGSTKFA